MSSPHYGISWSPGRLIDLDFADDIVMLSDSHDIIQHMTDDLNTNAAKVGLRISCEKKGYVCWGTTYYVNLNWLNLLQSVENFQCLGSYISNQSDIEVDIPARLGKAALVFLRLNRILSSTIKFRLYTSIVLSRALHACETWKLTASICNTLDVFHRRCIRKILGLSWQDRVTNEELMRRSGTQRDANPIRYSANSEAEIGRSSIKIA